jgi:hypothetical protein
MWQWNAFQVVWHDSEMWLGPLHHQNEGDGKFSFRHFQLVLQICNALTFGIVCIEIVEKELLEDFFCGGRGELISLILLILHGLSRILHDFDSWKRHINRLRRESA